jgi:hypothetical protein
MFRVMGEDTVLSGGVSLASSKDILAKLGRLDKTAAPRQQTSSTPPRNNPLPYETAKDGQSRHFGGQPSVWPATRQMHTASSQKPPAATVVLPQLPAGSSLLLADGTKIQVSEAAYGAFSSKKQQGQITLGWHKGPSIVMNDFVTALANLQQANAPRKVGEGIFRHFPEIQSVVRVQEWHTYLIKTTAITDGWIYLSINPAQVADYPAVAAGAFPNADIFCARLVDNGYARELAAGKEIIK